MSTVKSNADHLTLNADGASKDIKFQANGVEKASISSTGAMTATSYAGDGSALTNLPSSGGGKVKQIVNYQTGAAATGTTTMPDDDSIPQITEGDEYMTLAITPTSSTTKLRIDVVGVISTNYNRWLQHALFQDTTANALAATSTYHATGTALRYIVLSHTMTSGTTSATTFRFRSGPSSSATVTFNGYSGTRAFGGVAASSITITEYEV